MSETSWGERLDLFRYALLAALTAALVCPLLGAFLHVRRTSFYGIALPQFASAGVVLGFVLLPWWLARVGPADLPLDQALGDAHAAMNYHLAWASLFTFGGLWALVLLGRRGGSEIGRVAAAFAIANAATYIFGRISPIGRAFVEELLQGEILNVGLHDFDTLAAAYGLVLLVLLAFRHDFLLASFDREYALVSGRRVLWIESALNALTGITVAVGTLIVGPTLLFGLLVIPPLAARAWARSMHGYLLISQGFGVLAVLGGTLASFELDLPLGAAVVGVAALGLLPGLLLARRRA